MSCKLMTGGLLQGFVGCNPHCSGLEATGSFCRCSNTDDVDQINMKGKMHSVGHNDVNDELRKEDNTNLRKVNDITQVKFVSIGGSVLMHICLHIRLFLLFYLLSFYISQMCRSMRMLYQNLSLKEKKTHRHCCIRLSG